MCKLKELLRPRSILGATIIFIALLIFLENLGFGIFKSVLSNWPLALIIVGVSMLYGPNKNKHKATPYILIGLGLLFLLGIYNVFSIQWGKYIIPVLLLMIGIYFLKPRMLRYSEAEPHGNGADVFSVLSGGEYNTRSQKLKSGNIVCILGGADVDMREADMGTDLIELDVLCLMGGVEIKVPAHWQVSVKAIPFLGGVVNETTCLADAMQMPKKTLIVKGLVIMGGVEVKN